MQTQRFFAIESNGRMATQWLARCFSLHPEIYCSHGSSTDFSDRPADPKQFEKDNAALEPLEINQYFKQMQQARPERVLGNVHGFASHEYFTDVWYLDRPMYLCGLIRHPALRIQSYGNRWRWECESSEAVRQKREEGYANMAYMLNAVLERDQIRVGPETLEDRLIALAAFMVIGADGKVLRTRYPVFRYEDYTTSLASFQRLFAAVTKNLPASPSYFDEVWATAPLDETQDSPDARQIYDSWPVWFQVWFRFLFYRSGLRPDYEAAGYRFDGYL